MYASVTHVQIRVGTDAEANAIYRDEILPTLRTFQGWARGELFTNAKAGEGMAINYYAAEDDANRTEASGDYQRLMGKMAHLMVAPPTRKVYEVFQP